MWNKLKERKYIAVVVAFILFLVFSFLITGLKNKEVEPKAEIIKVDQVQKEKEVEINYKVDIKGAVNHPGVYELSEASRIIDGIEKAGGLTKEADTTLINLSKKIEDGMVIIVYTKEEINKYQESMKTPTINETVQLIEKECLPCPDEGLNGACINQVEVGEKISINQATIEELDSLPGIGLTKAEAIIEYRNKNGEFKNIEELMFVSGIGSSLFDQIKDLITV